MKKFFGFRFFTLLALSLSNQAMADFDPRPLPLKAPFESMTCTGENTEVHVKLLSYRQTNGAGAASIKANGVTWNGGWSLKPAQLRTRLSGYSYLDIKSQDLDAQGPFVLLLTYTPYGELKGGWLEMPGSAGAVDCKIDKIESETTCQVSPQSDCSTSPKRVCCDCADGHLSCY